jgi:hypothetical protein
MIRKATAYILCCYFLAGSLVLPLGDFSLIKDLPQMYQAYQKLASPDECGIFDFVGDYLLGGKVLLGHNKSDIPETAKSNVQYQHAASFCSILVIPIQTIILTVVYVAPIHANISTSVNTSEFHKEFFRPPLNTLI